MSLKCTFTLNSFWFNLLIQNIKQIWPITDFSKILMYKDVLEICCILHARPFGNGDARVFDFALAWSNTPDCKYIFLWSIISMGSFKKNTTIFFSKLKIHLFFKFWCRFSELRTIFTRPWTFGIGRTYYLFRHQKRRWFRVKNIA